MMKKKKFLHGTVWVISVHIDTEHIEHIFVVFLRFVYKCLISFFFIQSFKCENMMITQTFSKLIDRILNGICCEKFWSRPLAKYVFNLSMELLNCYCNQFSVPLNSSILSTANFPKR